MRKLLAITAIVAAAALVVTGCGADDNDGNHGPMNNGEEGTPMGDEGMPMGDGQHDEASPAADDAREIEMTARSFEFDPDEIRASVGENLAVVLTSEDIEHDFQIDELDAHVSVGPGDTNTGGFTATEAGRYTYWCTVSGHREAGMEGTLIVG